MEENNRKRYLLIITMVVVAGLIILALMVFGLLFTENEDSRSISNDIQVTDGGNVLDHNMFDYVVDIDIEEYDIPDEVYTILSEHRVHSFYHVGDKYVLLHQPYDNDNASEQLMLLDSDFTVLFTYDHEDIQSLTKVINSDEFIIKVCDNSNDCVHKVFDVTGQELVEINDLSYIRMDDGFYPLIQGENGLYYGKKIVDWGSDTPTYRFISIDGTEETNIYQFVYDRIIFDYMLANDSIIVSYENIQETHNFIYIRPDGEVSVLYENNIDYINFDVVSDGYILFADETIYRMDLEGNIIWQFTAQGLRDVDEETEEYLLFESDSTQYKVYNDGTYETTELQDISYPIDYSYTTLVTFNNNSRLVWRSSDEFTGVQYLRSPEEIIWQYEIDSIYGVVLHDNDVYVNISETEFVLLDNDGKVIENYNVGGRLQFITDYGNYVLKVRVEDYISEEYSRPIEQQYFKEITPSLDVVWETSALLGELEMFDLRNGFYATGLRKEISAFPNPNTIESPSYQHIYSNAGILKHTFNYRSATLMYATEEEMFYSSRYSFDDSSYTKSRITIFDLEYNVIAEYQSIGYDGSYYGLKDGNIYIITSNKTD